MKYYRIIEDSYSGYEVQVKYSWFPFIWFQVSHYYWINTWSTQEKAIDFIKEKKFRNRIDLNFSTFLETDGNAEFERESKLLLYKMKNFFPRVVWTDVNMQTSSNSRRRFFPGFNTLTGLNLKYKN